MKQWLNLRNLVIAVLLGAFVWKIVESDVVVKLWNGITVSITNPKTQSLSNIHTIMALIFS